MTPAEFMAAMTATERPLECLVVRELDTQAQQRLVADCERLVAAETYSVASTPAHPTAWTRPHGEIRQYSLLTASGRCDDTRRDHDHSCFGKRFWPAAEYPVLAGLLDELPHCVNARLNWMAPGARLEPHRESILYRAVGGGVGIKIRFHLPVRTNAAASVMVAGTWYHLAAGTASVVNNGLVHSAANDSDEVRIHLVWDCLLTAEVFDALIADPVPEGTMLRPISSRGPARTPRILRTGPVPPAFAMESAVAVSDVGELRLASVQ